MSNSSDLEVRKREISAMLNDVAATEQHFRDQGVELADPDEWMQLKDIVARIERRLLANTPSNGTEKINMDAAE